MCQCPTTGNLHFYDIISGGEIVKEGSVNALQRATFISTLPRKIPCKYWVFETFFAGIFQNILKKSFLKAFLALFTLCS